MKKTTIIFFSLCCVSMTSFGGVSIEKGPDRVACFDIYELIFRLDEPYQGNPFTDVELKASFTPQDGPSAEVEGFCDDQEGRVFKIRFCPGRSDSEYTFQARTNVTDQVFTGSFKTGKPRGMEPVIVHPQHPKHFIYAASRKPFYHLGITAYHLLDPSNDDKHIEAFLDYSAANGFNKARFLIAGYPRDSDTRSSDDYEYGVGNQWRLPNYGAPPGEVNPLPAWLGLPHQYDFTRFNVDYWRKVDRAVGAMRERGMIATCIITLEKQNLPKEYGTLTSNEKRLYQYAVARLAAYANVWWDLGNEHNEYRAVDWAPQMGALVKQWDPYDRLCSAHGHADWNYGDQKWADFIITQQYGSCQEVNQWALQYYDIPKPYINEEYGYEGTIDKPGHGMNVDWVRKCHWSIAAAGGYATYGDWSPGTPFYTGHIGQGKAPSYLKRLRNLFESFPYQEMSPHNELVNNGSLCLAKEKEVYLVYMPDGGETVVRFSPREDGYSIVWVNPRTGDKKAPIHVTDNRALLKAPDSNDWVVIIKG